MLQLPKIGKSLAKNLPEIRAFATGQMPAFMYGKRAFSDIPVFCFHAVMADRFERQLRFLRDNSYVTLDSRELDARLNDPAYRNNGKEIVLTFDDGLISLWTVAFPLLEQFNIKVISFILPGLTDDAGPGEPSASPKLSSWPQIRLMHQSGLVDFQSHGMVHPFITVGSTIVDFVHPGYQCDYYGVSQIPFYGDGTPQGDDRAPVLGHPIYRHASRHSGKPRYFDDLRVREECAAFVERQGPAFFSRPDWRSCLMRIVTEFKARNTLSERVETPDERDQAIRYELHQSKRSLEFHLEGKQVRHFCNPWYVGSELMARMALGAGYSALHLGASAGFRCRKEGPVPRLVLRLQEEYLMALPGAGRVRLSNVIRDKLASSRRRQSP